LSSPPPDTRPHARAGMEPEEEAAAAAAAAVAPPPAAVGPGGASAIGAAATTTTTGPEEGAGAPAANAAAANDAANDAAANDAHRPLDHQAGLHGCSHYRRRCKIVAPCCGNRVFACRHCHNQQADEAEPDPTKRHTLDRRSVVEVVCSLCDSRQPVAPSCSHCGVSFGRYFCPTCVFFDDDLTRGQWHCDRCGICRVGGRDNFYHCDRCASCLSVSLRDEHTCVDQAMKRCCPICMEYLFDSVRAISVLPRCGHVLHQDCLSALLSRGAATCPICLRSAVGGASQERLWRGMDEAVAATPMPDEYRGVRVPILCNDCGARSTVQLHVVGHKCGAAGCGGYNTRRV
jgi:RING finger and CHY zinc finger domain-containing protein 1